MLSVEELTRSLLYLGLSTCAYVVSNGENLETTKNYFKMDQNGGIQWFVSPTFKFFPRIRGKAPHSS